MKIVVSQSCDGFAVTVDGVRTRFDQEEVVQELAAIFKELRPDAEVIYEEEY